MLQPEIVQILGNEPITPNIPRDLDELLTVEEGAAMLKVSESWVYEHSGRGAIR